MFLSKGHLKIFSIQVDSEIREKENEIQKKRPAFIKAKEKTSHMQKKVDGAKKSLALATKAHKAHVSDVQALESDLRYEN